MDSEANFFVEEEDLDMLIERQGDVNEEEDGDDDDRRPAGSDDEAQEVPARKKKADEKGANKNTSIICV
jgi:hypothetical protein